MFCSYLDYYLDHILIMLRTSLELWLDETICVALSLIYNIHFVCLCVSKYIKIVSQKIHLNACILRIHRLNCELLCSDDLDIIIILYVLIHESFIEIRHILLLIYELLAMLCNLSLDNLYNKVD